jgi:limonene 1,2-monooxygenase
MDEALGVITRLLRSDEPVTMKTDWFELREARLHLAPYTAPHFPIAVANMFTPTGMKAAGKHNIGVISLGAGMPGGPEAMAEQWKIAEAEATKYGHTMDRKNWRIVVNMHVAEDDEQALREVYQGERLETVKYFEEGLGRPVGRTEDPLRDGVANGSTLVGTPETVIKGIKRLIEYSNGGFGCMLFKAGDWATREQTLRSYELFARWVMPHFQGSLVKPTKSYEWVKANNQTLFSPNVAAIKKAFADSGEEMPEELKGRLHGGRYS